MTNWTVSGQAFHSICDGLAVCVKVSGRKLGDPGTVGEVLHSRGYGSSIYRRNWLPRSEVRDAINPRPVIIVCMLSEVTRPRVDRSFHT